MKKLYVKFLEKNLTIKYFFNLLNHKRIFLLGFIEEWLYEV